MRVLVIGGAGYVGSVLCPYLTTKFGIDKVLAFDKFWYGDTLPREIGHIEGDIRDREALKRALKDCDAVIHLACISNDPSFDMQPELGKSINWDCFPMLCEEVKAAGVSRFIYASSSSVYGVHETGNVIESSECSPLTDYSKYKLMCEEHLKSCDMGDVCWTILRPATVCGYSKRLRLDLVVNVLTISALIRNRITVNGGSQLRPNINIRDMVRAYYYVLMARPELIHGQTFNVGAENISLSGLASKIQSLLGGNLIEVEHVESNDNRSYHVDSSKIARVLGFIPVRRIDHAVLELNLKHSMNEIPNALTDSKYYNIRRMKELFP